MFSRQVTRCLAIILVASMFGSPGFAFASVPCGGDCSRHTACQGTSSPAGVEVAKSCCGSSGCQCCKSLRAANAKPAFQQPASQALTCCQKAKPAAVAVAATSQPSCRQKSTPQSATQQAPAIQAAADAKSDALCHLGIQPCGHNPAVANLDPANDSNCACQVIEGSVPAPVQNSSQDSQTFKIQLAIAAAEPCGALVDCPVLAYDKLRALAPPTPAGASLRTLLCSWTT